MNFFYNTKNVHRILLSKQENHVINCIKTFKRGRFSSKSPTWFTAKKFVKTKLKPPTNLRSFKSAADLPKRALEGDLKGFSCLIRPAIFTFVVGGVSYTTAAIWQYENLFTSQPKRSNNFNFDWMLNGSKRGEFRQQINLWWNSLSPGEKSVTGIIALNGLVFMLWRVPAMYPFLTKYFTASPMASATCLPMLLSTFSHHSSLHLLANMYVLWSFTPSITAILGNEQFVATYLTAGVVSSLGSYLIKVSSRSVVPSLGASGAIMAILGMVCWNHPNARLSIAFISSIFPHSFSADSALKGLIILDSLGILLRWRLFDHAAHLVGVMFGLWYLNYGSRLTWQKREPLVRKWHAWRSGKE